MEKNDTTQTTKEPINDSVISVKEWLITLLISFIPLVNVILFMVWGFGGGVNPNKASFARASLIFVLIYFLAIAFSLGRYLTQLKEMLFI
ncbi:MAG: hypothetical protein ACRC9Q_05020 [Bacteroidales bacterium]